MNRLGGYPASAGGYTGPVLLRVLELGNQLNGGAVGVVGGVRSPGQLTRIGATPGAGVFTTVAGNSGPNRDAATGEVLRLLTSSSAATASVVSAEFGMPLSFRPGTYPTFGRSWIRTTFRALVQLDSTPANTAVDFGAKTTAEIMDSAVTNEFGACWAVRGSAAGGSGVWGIVTRQALSGAIVLTEYGIDPLAWHLMELVHTEGPTPKLEFKCDGVTKRTLTVATGDLPAALSGTVSKDFLVGAAARTIGGGVVLVRIRRAEYMLEEIAG